MSKGGSHDETIKIFLRIRPAANPSDNYVIDRSSFDKAAVTFHIDKNNTEMFNNQIEDYRFQFDDAFDRPTTQEQIFESVAKPCVDNVTQGYNSTIFAYGQTGSGKTFSITGGSESYAQRGIIPRCIAAIFDYAKRATCETSVRVSYMQIYQDKAQDLLNGGQDARSIEDLPKVSVLEIEDDFVVKNLGRFPVCSLAPLPQPFPPQPHATTRNHTFFTCTVRTARGSAELPVYRRHKQNLLRDVDERCMSLVVCLFA